MFVSPLPGNNVNLFLPLEDLHRFHLEKPEEIKPIFHPFVGSIRFNALHGEHKDGYNMNVDIVHG